MSPTKIDRMNTPSVDASSRILPADAERKIREDAGVVVETAKQEVLGVADEIGSQAGAALDQAKSEIGKVAEKAKDAANEQKQFVAEQIEGVADVVSKVASELEASDSSSAGYARTLADTVTSFSETVKSKNVDELLAMAQDFGRKQPVVFMGAAALMGFAASRFLTSSADRSKSAPPTSATIRRSFDGSTDRQYGNGAPSSDPMGAL